MDRPTTTLTPAGSSDVIVLKTYATAQEKRDTQLEYNKAVSDLPEAEQKMTGRVYGLLQDFALRTIIVSVNGRKNGDSVDGATFDVIQYLLQLPSQQFDEIYDAVREVLDGQKKKATT